MIGRHLSTNRYSIQVCHEYPTGLPLANIVFAEWIYGMMSPTAPLVNRQLIWHMYSAQAYGIFHGDLDFYFGKTSSNSDSAPSKIRLLNNSRWLGRP